MQNTFRTLLCLAVVLAAASTVTAQTIPGPDPDLLEMFNHPDGFSSDPGDPIRIVDDKHYGHITVLKIADPGGGGSGGGLGGEKYTFSYGAAATGGKAVVEIHIFDEATGELVRDLFIPIVGEIHTGPRTPGDPVQSFDTEMVSLQGELPAGDPDFASLRITGGSDFGLPSPGHTTLTQQGSGGTSYAVDSFFDITYQIEFEGNPGGMFGDASGTDTGTVRIGLGHQAPSVPEPSTFALAALGLLGLIAYFRRRK